MFRTAINSLYEWKESKYRKPLIIEGARQVGKTWLMKEFGKQAYDNCYYINFDSNAAMADLFSKDLDGLVRKGGRAKDYEAAIMWLSDCGLIHRIGRVTTPNIPLKAYEDLKAFKLFLVDVGLLGCMTGLSQRTLVEGNRLFIEFKGTLTEQYVLQQLLTEQNNQIYYYTNDRGS